MEETAVYKRDYSTPQRQSPAAIFILIMRSGISILKAFWPALVVILFKSNNDSKPLKLLAVVLAFSLLSVLFALLRFLFYKFHITNNNLVISTGFIKKKTLSIPLQSIQAVHLEQNLWQQVFRVVKVSFDSAGSEKVEAKIDALQLEMAEELKEILLSQTTHQHTEAPAETLQQPGIYRLSAADLLRLSLSANHLEAFFILLALGLNLLNDLKDIFKLDSWGWFGKFAESTRDNTLLAISFMIFLVAIVSIVFSVGRTIIRYFDFTLTSTNENWKINYGLLNRQQRIIPLNKIQVYSWHSNWVRRKINFWMLDVKVIGQDHLKQKQQQKLPITSIQAAIDLAGAYQQSPVFNTASGNMIEAAYWKRTTIMIGIPVTLALVLIGSIWLHWQALWIGIIFFYFAYRNYRWYKNYRWQANDEGLQTYSGAWGRRYTLLAWKKVQQVRFTQSPYQRSHQLASVKFVTAGGVVSLPYISLSTAMELVNNVLYLVESREESWM